jgi:alpha-beta hydrolase superfamily lysophospholipase
MIRAGYRADRLESMQREEIRDAGALLGTALGELAEAARDVHRGVSARVVGLLGAPATPVRVLHDAIAGVAYGSARLSVRAVPAALGAASAELATRSADSVHASRRTHLALNALNGFWGDRLADRQPSLACAMTLRTHRGELRAVPANVAFDAWTDASGRLAVFVHGLCESDRAWWLAAARRYGDADVTYGSRLRADSGWTPLYLSYNTGLHVSDNGEQLAAFLDDLVAAWPVPVTDIALIGHSMGALVARSAAHQAHEQDRTWLRSLRHVVGLGAPNTGAPLERLVNAGTHTLARLPETRPFATWLNGRSVGIKDLRYGAVVRADWFERDPDERLVDRCAPATLLDGVTYSAASATLSRRSDGRLAHDLLVQHASAHGVHPTRRIAFEPEHLLHLGGKHHFDLLNDPQVYAHLSRWLNG